MDSPDRTPHNTWVQQKKISATEYKRIENESDEPIRNVSGTNFPGDVEHRVAHHASAERFWKLTNQMTGQKATMRTAKDRYLTQINLALSKAYLQHGSDAIVDILTTAFARQRL